MDQQRLGPTVHRASCQFQGQTLSGSRPSSSRAFKHTLTGSSTPKTVGTPRRRQIGCSVPYPRGTRLRWWDKSRLLRVRGNLGKVHAVPRLCDWKALVQDASAPVWQGGFSDWKDRHLSRFRLCTLFLGSGVGGRERYRRGVGRMGISLAGGVCASG